MDKRLEYFKNNSGYDRILETRDDRDFLEIISTQGGDVSRYRVYGKKDGNPDTFEIFEK